MAKTSTISNKVYALHGCTALPSDRIVLNKDELQFMSAQPETARKKDGGLHPR